MSLLSQPQQKLPNHQDQLSKSLRKFGKSLERAGRNDSPENVHQLRTRSRRLEAAIQAVQLDDKRRVHRLLKTIARLRGKAGKVRDLDVLIGFAAKLAVPGEEESLVRLLEHLETRRRKAARKLHASIASGIHRAKRQLKRCRALFKSEDAAFAGQQLKASAAASSLFDELASWPRLTRTNLHPYRIKVKELRYTLQLMADADRELTHSLEEATDAIGEWHDWSELQDIAISLLGGNKRLNLLQAIRSTVSEKLRHALSLANALQKHYAISNAPARHK